MVTVTLAAAMVAYFSLSFSSIFYVFLKNALSLMSYEYSVFSLCDGSLFLSLKTLSNASCTSYTSMM